ncbi:hypothetical protein [Novosphingobium album (ex Hu et al. 2023)]|uniref:PepSY domain-containing protein n=1 Tax=Novosphingobium album (ex Hu et al. 2023) TaxID=2930093 RepID=A0ABT0B112_9SPHN|nr:hypothetical protein [Novosphingobium album (ex Hu et al. 2023)]MCJ2178590.1 hypothetical protein [Novosphingobium album (ex Hu et al. 2023)]
MKKSIFHVTATAMLASTVVGANPAFAEKANQLSSINGKDAWGAEQALKERGFKSISSHKNSRGYINSYWWNKSDDNCVRVEVYNDTVESIVDAKDSDCGKSGGNTTAAVGAVAGLALLGAVLASKSHHQGDKNYNEREQAEFDRGYKDGLYNASYHNYSRSDAYSHGYEVGVDERNANLSHHHNRGGYSNVAEFKDLQGARAAGAMDELNRRGFVQVDNFASGNARYSIRWRQQSNQCLQLIVANGRIDDVRDIQTHPKCRSGHSGGSSIGSDGKTWYQRLVGAAGDGAEVQLGNNGFRKVDTFESGKHAYGTVWYNRSSRQCLQVITANGRVDSASDIQTHPRCR